MGERFGEKHPLAHDRQRAHDSQQHADRDHFRNGEGENAYHVATPWSVPAAGFVRSASFATRV